MPASTSGGRSRRSPPLPEVYSARELAVIAQVPSAVVRELLGSADIPTIDGRLVAGRDALAAVRALRSGALTADPYIARPSVFAGALLRRYSADPQSRGLSALMTTALHAAVILFMVIFMVILTSVQSTTAAGNVEPAAPRLARLVFIDARGPGARGVGRGIADAAAPPTRGAQGGWGAQQSDPRSCRASAHRTSR